MSLLMDALKRAEKARQAEASSDGAELDLASTQGFSLERDEGAESTSSREPTLDQPVSPGDDALSLESTQAMEGRLGIEGEDTGSRSIDDTGSRSLDDSISLIDDEDAVDVPHTIPSDTSATLPSLKQAQRSVDNYFDGTGSASLTRDDIQSALATDATAPHQRVGPGDTETQRRVRAVFHAKEASRGRRGRNWVVAGLVPLILLCAIGAAVLVFWDPISQMFFDEPVRAQRPRPAQPVPQPTPAVQPSVAVVTSESPSQPTTVAQAPAQPQAAPTPTPTDQGAVTAQTEPTPPAAQEPATGGGAGETVAAAGGDTRSVGSTGSGDFTRQMTESAPTVAQVTQSVDPSGRRLSPQETVERELQRRGLAPASPAEGGSFKITRRSKPDKLHPRLTKAYDAWLAGDLATAKRDYARVLRASPRNRNALLGLGAIAVREGEWDKASEYYTELLNLNPKDSIAQAGIIAIHDNVDPLRGESQIKLLLREEPEAPHLHFTLGNMYADQRRWGEAQAAYFDAYRLQSNNADYAYNLAVSLDQLGQSKAAGDYYRVALDLAAKNGAVFDQPGVRDRLLKLALEDSAR